MGDLKPKKVEENIVKNPLQWFDDRLPIFSFINDHLGKGYLAPKNLNYMWNFGSLAGIALVIQILTGLFLAMYYKADVALAFDSVQYIMREVPMGWLIRNLHVVGASFFFIVVYAHIARALYYGSYKSPREVLWWFGIIIYLIMMGTAFLGYVLPYGKMSLAGAQVITNLLTVIPFVGDELLAWVMGGPSIDNAALGRFYVLHFLLPFLIVGLVVIHIWALHMHKSNNPEGIPITKKEDTVPFHPYYTAKDAFGLGVYLFILCAFVFFAPEFFSHSINYVNADPLSTPDHIVPEWYFLPFYAILRAIPSKEIGVIAMLAAILILFILPWLDRSKVRSAKYRPIYRQLFWIFIVNALVLGWVGGKNPEGIYVLISRFATVIYFAFFLVLPLVAKIEKTPVLPTDLSHLKKHLWLFAVLLSGLGMAGTASAAGAVHVDKQDWGFNKLNAEWDKDQLYRGYKVATQVCMACHGFKYVSHRTLVESGGFTEAEAKILAAELDLQLNDVLLSGLDDESAQELYGKKVPDLSLMNKARDAGADYTYAITSGYVDEESAEGKKEIAKYFPEGVPEGAYYNRYYPGHAIAMPNPLTGDDLVEYHDKTPATIEQMARDVTYFMQFTAEPERVNRHKMGFYVMLYLFIFVVLSYLTKKAVWRDVH